MAKVRNVALLPVPWVIYEGNPSNILISGPGLEHSRIPPAWYRRKVK